MKKFNNVFVETTLRESNFDIHDFDLLKDVIRQNGIVEDHSTILCGDRIFRSMENYLIDYIKDYSQRREGQSGDRVFMKNGIIFHLYKIEGIHEWTYLIFPGEIDVTSAIPHV